MKRAVRTVVAAACAVLVLVLPIPPAHACSCAGAPVDEHVANATVVFTGRADDTKEAPEGLVTTFRVVAIYKGSAGRTVDIATADDEAACGVPFVEGRTYAVFAQAQGGSLVTTLCAGTTDDLASISGLTPIALQAEPRAGPDGGPSGVSRSAPIAIAGLLIALVSAAAALAVRASRRPRPIA